MGLFREAGRRIEQFKQAAEAAAEEDADYHCEDCGEAVFTEVTPESCPECGADALVANETAEDGETAGDETARNAETAED
ncbi:MAG: hypothetical protein ABEH77_03635 [Halobacteriaceae archaeon]